MATKQQIKLINKQQKTLDLIQTATNKETVCPNLRFCKNPESCGFKHNIKTKLCKFANKCKFGKNCVFAHNESEIYVFPCKFGIECKNPKCSFKHPINFFEKTNKENNNEKALEPVNIKDAELFPKTINYEKPKNKPINYNPEHLEQLLEKENNTLESKYQYIKGEKVFLVDL